MKRNHVPEVSCEKCGEALEVINKYYSPTGFECFGIMGTVAFTYKCSKCGDIVKKYESGRAGRDC